VNLKRSRESDAQADPRQLSPLFWRQIGGGSLEVRKNQKVPDSVKQIISQKLKGRRSSPATEFKKGHIPWNKGLKRRGLQYAYHNSSETKFKPGHKPWNWKPVGSMTIRIDNRGKPVRHIKTAEPHKWDYYSRYIWKRTRQRSIPKGHIIYHQDGNQLNDNPENLICIPRALSINFQKIDIEDMEKNRLENCRKALFQRWEAYRQRLAQGVL
jgi:hypothetical protein